MSGALISYRNDADEGVFLEGSPQPGYPLENMQTRQLSTVSRMSWRDPFVVDLGASRRVRLVAMLAVNTDFKVGIQASIYWANSPSGPWNYVPVVWPFDPTTRAGVRASNDVAPALHCVIPAGISARYWQINPAWGRLGGDTYAECGRLWIGDAIVVPEGAMSQWALGIADGGRLDSSAGLQRYEDPRPRARVLDCSFDVESPLAFGFGEDASGAVDTPSFQGLQQGAGRTGEVIVLPRTNTPMWPRRTGVYGHIPDGTTIRHIAGPRYAVDLRVLEER